MMEALSNFVAAQAAIHPVIATLLMVIGVVRAINKPLFSFIHSVDQAAGLTKTDAVVSEVEASKAYQYFCYGLDWALSIKVGTQAPAPAPEKAA